jgi:protein-tyrosine kinase
MAAVDLSNVRALGHERGLSVGAILVEAGKLSPSDADEIQRYAIEKGIRFGDAAVHMNRISADDIQLALAKQYKYLVLPRGHRSGVSEVVVAAYNPLCEVVEQLRTVRSRLSLGWLKSAQRNVLAVTSPERGEGRSWFAANLATVFAQAGVRTLLVDADMRHPQQHRLFNLPSEVGLSWLLTGRAGKEIVHRIHPDLRLFVAPAGQLPPNPQELLIRDVFGVVLSRFSKQFDLVVLDTPAAAETADAEILAARAGAAIMLTRRNHTSHASLLAAMECLTRSGVQVIGSVLNEY